MAVRPKYQRKGWALLVGGAIIKAGLVTLTRRTWIDAERIPARGGCVIVLNHLSHVDPLIAAHVVWDHGRLPRYLAKDALWHNRFLGALLRNAQQIPVSRDGAAASTAFDAAVRAVEAGECVIVYPEGTLTRDPGLWPMLGRTGAARIALRTGCPVIPIGQWGAQDLLAPYAKKPNLLPRTHVTLKVGEPVDLSAYAERPLTTAVLLEATETIMTAITDLVAEIRGERPPAERYDPRRRARPAPGDAGGDGLGTTQDTRQEGEAR
ncbi:1-acyl-sn-glycerol-3-phosphate acyltransferase [Nocardioides sp. CFH 31398]|uniref:lysophospholipid acyltransferase family protein n=1 Tax=Nocardioides sp. CFH 31398 TaxID=2919579 RepID=UPI001F0563A2|nr:lysophospholipid acyltransferase family protein [Nocardioides sp. CFH 31398]MCH1867364.1 1-acyl-sn-glycerol-3-phosphate acyltransferase [Nocardioides sp. CFH 31398]